MEGREGNKERSKVTTFQSPNDSNALSVIVPSGPPGMSYIEPYGEWYGINGSRYFRFPPSSDRDAAVPC